MEVKHDLLHIFLQANQSKTYPCHQLTFLTGIHKRRSCVVRDAAVHSGKKWHSALWLNHFLAEYIAAMHFGRK